ncbi:MULTISPECIES: alanine racemase [unclassified Staphylococcus]|uniref:alanine racemase n=1 Tax=unclassified Staphylococcus TaxID=91994 RepID=UPI00203A7903|nr:MULTISPECIES: alanine racemase [unclassified Staphylococcus]
MAQLKIDLSKIQYNAHILRDMCKRSHIHFTPVVKGVGGDERIIQSLAEIGITHFADARIDNIRKSYNGHYTYTMIRTGNQSELKNIVNYTNISIQTELETIQHINQIAKSLNKTHEILLMVDWKDEREGIQTYEVIEYINKIVNMQHVKMKGLAFNFMCFHSDTPTTEDIQLINEFVTHVESQTALNMQIVSGGNSSVLPEMAKGPLGKINELRIGETLFRGVNTTTDTPIPALYQDAITLEAEIVEIKPRLRHQSHHDYLQAILDIGNLDTKIPEIQPLHHEVDVLGATSDHVMVDLYNHDNYQVGDKIQFSLGYSAMAQSMYMPNITKTYVVDEAIQIINENFDKVLGVSKNIHK